MKLIDKKSYPWLVVALLWIVALLNYMDRQMLSTMQESMKADIQELNQAEAFGALMAVFLWIYGLVSPFAGLVADRVSASGSSSAASSCGRPSRWPWVSPPASTNCITCVGSWA
ncbi:hypothetical protein [Segatella baroniae]|uniref:hypothetical protein n=1 Tax=Segatella baroniae TaxID=305719 RepID=UPI000AC7FDF0